MLSDRRERRGSTSQHLHLPLEGTNAGYPSSHLEDTRMLVLRGGARESIRRGAGPV